MNGKISLITLSGLALIFGSMAAPSTSEGWTESTVRVITHGPMSGGSGGKTVKTYHATYYYCSSSYSLHEALDIHRQDGTGCAIGSGGADVTAVFERYNSDGTVKKSKYEWVYRTGDSCSGTSGGDNQYKVLGDNTWQVVYGHLNKHGNKGTVWAAWKDPIGKLGSTGNSTGPHVHLQNDKNWVKKTYWYKEAMTSHGLSQTTCGTNSGAAKTVGYAKMQDTAD